MRKKEYNSKGRKEDAEKARQRMRKYSKSKLGMKVRAEYRDRNRKRIREYMREYFRRRREKGAEEGLCGNCLKRKRIDGITFCQECRDNVRRNAQNQKLKRQGGKVKMAKNRGRTTKKEKEAAELWEIIKKSEASDKLPIDVDMAIKHLKEVLKDEESNR